MSGSDMFGMFTANWPNGDFQFNGGDTSGWNGGGDDGPFNTQASVPAASTPSFWPSAHSATPSFGSPAAYCAPHGSGMMFPDVSAAPLPYRYHNGSRAASDTELRAQYNEPTNYPPQLPALEQQLDFFLDPVMDSATTARDPWVEFVEAELYQHSITSSSRSSVSSPLYYSDDIRASSRFSTPYSDSGTPDVFTETWDSTGENVSAVSSPRFTSMEPEIDTDKDASELHELPTGSPLKFVVRESAARTSGVGALPERNDVDIRGIDNLFEDCEWRRSDIVWLDDGIWSEYITFPKGVSLTSGKPLARLERVHGGIPTELPHLSEPTAFILTAPDSARDDGLTMDNLFRSGCPHSFTGSTGAPAGDTSILGLFFPSQDPAKKIDPKAKITVRRAVPTCRGILACESLDESLIVGERRELDPHAKRNLAHAQLRTRELQGTSRVGQVLTFISAMERFHCRGVLLDKSRCGGKAVLEKLDAPKHGKTYAVACSERHTEVADGFPHSEHHLPPHIDEGILRDALDGRRVIDGEDLDGCCSMTKSLSKNHGGQAYCGMEHTKDGTRFKAKMVKIPCGAKITFFVPIAVYTSLDLTCIAYPHPQTPHRHITASGTKCPHQIREEYISLALEYGSGVTVNSQLAKTRFGGKTPSEYHPSLINQSLKTRLIREARKRSSARGPMTRAEETASHVAWDQASDDPYIQSSISRAGKSIYFGANPRLLCRAHKLRTIDMDTSFKPVDGALQMFEVNGWLWSHACMITVLRILRLITTLTSQRLRFKNLHPGGTMLGLLSDMEAAPLLGFADAVWDTLTPARQAEIETPISLLPYVLRICHLIECRRGVDSDQLKDLSVADREHVRSLKYCTTCEEFEEWKVKFAMIKDPNGRLRAYWRHKEMHTFILPGLVQPLSKIHVDDWHLMPANTNIGEGQHRWNNIQTGVSMTPVESMKRYKALDAEQEARLAQAELTGDLRNEHNETVDRCVNSMSRKAGAIAKTHRVRTLDEHVRLRTILLNEAKEALQTAKEESQSNRSQLAKQRVEAKKQQVLEAEKALALAKAESNSNSSGRVPLPRVQTRTTATTVTPAMPTTPAVASTSVDALDLPQPHPSTSHVEEPMTAMETSEAPTTSIPADTTPDLPQPPTPVTPPGEPIATAEPAEAPVRQLRKRSRAEGTTTRPVNPSKRTKKDEGELNLDWEMVVDGKRWWARDFAHENREEFKLEWPKYAHLVDNLN
ncbi:hypothetical protein C8F01DRAFT_1264833 [Mycena amicta]|nr:hypothetical protein C8F01DRAFT_1264833 [Mycena amicta]